MNEEIFQDTIIAKVYCLVAARRHGKTTLANKLLETYPGKALPVDTFDHPSYRHLPELPVEPKEDEDWQDALRRTLKKWKKGKYRLFRGDVQDNLEVIFSELFDCFVIMEDASKMFDDRLPRRLRAGFIDSRNRGVDLLLMYHTFSDIPEFVAKQTNEFIVFKTEDDLTINYKKFGSTWAKLKEAQHHVRQMVDSEKKPRWYNVTVTKQ